MINKTETYNPKPETFLNMFTRIKSSCYTDIYNMHTYGVISKLSGIYVIFTPSSVLHMYNKALQKTVEHAQVGNAL